MVGSNNGLAPWTGLGNTAATPEQVAEERHRMAGAIATCDATFHDARRHQRRGGSCSSSRPTCSTRPSRTRRSPTTRRSSRSCRRSSTSPRRFRGPVYLFNGDSHVFNQDRPLAAGSSWLPSTGSASADNLQRVTVDGSDLGETDWLKVTVTADREQPLSWRRVPGA